MKSYKEFTEAKEVAVDTVSRTGVKKRKLVARPEDERESGLQARQDAARDTVDESMKVFRSFSSQPGKNTIGRASDEGPRTVGSTRPGRTRDRGFSAIPHAVHIDGKKWKTFGSRQHAMAVASTLQKKGHDAHVVKEGMSPEQQAAIAIAKKESGKYNKDGKRIKK